MSALSRTLGRVEGPAGRVVPPAGMTASLTTFSAAAMAFLAVFALALSLAAGRLADGWSEALARTATIRISAPQGQMAAQTAVVLEILRTTPGVAGGRALTTAEQRALLEPWFGPDLPVESLPVPQLVEVIGNDGGYDADGLRLRLSAEAPGAVFDDHTRWRQPLVAAAGRLRALGLSATVLIGGVVAAMITLAARAALAANAPVIAVLRLIGARDVFIARAFVRRFTLRAFGGAALGTGLGMTVMAFLPATDAAGTFLPGLGFESLHWLWPLAIPPLAGAVAFVATRAAALRCLRELT